MPYGFPSGPDLVQTIMNYDGEGETRFDPVMRKTLRESDQLSIDAFLEHRPEFIEEGKRAIAFHLIQQERHERLFCGDRDWYSHILNRMAAGIPFEELQQNKVSFITFNYDRSLEHFLFTAILNRYNRTREEVASLFEHIPILHVHGQLGYLPWQHTDVRQQREYSVIPGRTDIKIAATGITIISEKEDDSTMFQCARKYIQEAQRVAILGFGYHPVNMRRLDLPLGTPTRIEGTCFGFTDTERAEHANARYPGLGLCSHHFKIMDYLRNSTILS